MVMLPLSSKPESHLTLGEVVRICSVSTPDFLREKQGKLEHSKGLPLNSVLDGVHSSPLKFCDPVENG